MSKSKSVYVVLSRSSTILSSAINIIKGDSYTHAAISLDSQLLYMFSFGRRRAWNPFIGCFKRESIGEGLYKRLDVLPGIIMEIPVTAKQHNMICTLIEGFLSAAHIYGYNYFGLAGNLLGVTREDNRRFFCSEFVYHILHESGVCDLGIPRGMVRPQNLLDIDGRVIFDGDLKTLGKKPCDAGIMPRSFSFS